MWQQQPVPIPRSHTPWSLGATRAHLQPWERGCIKCRSGGAAPGACDPSGALDSSPIFPCPPWSRSLLWIFLTPQPGLPLPLLDPPSILSAHRDEATRCTAPLCPGTVRGCPVPRHSASASHPSLEDSPGNAPISSPGQVSTAPQIFLKAQPHPSLPHLQAFAHAISPVIGMAFVSLVRSHRHKPSSAWVVLCGQGDAI